LETLEGRTVPSVLFDNAATATVSDGGGRVLDHVEVELVYWGSAWAANTNLQGNVTDAVDSMLAGPYFSALSQYRSTIGNGSRVGTATITSSSPPSVFHNSDVKAMLRDAINAHAVPSSNSNGQLLYMVIPQPGTSAGGQAGEHSYDYSTEGLYHYGWTINDGSLDTITLWFSQELVEAVTDPEGTAIQVNPRNTTDWNEIGDHEAEDYSYRLNNVKVQSYFSARDHAYIVPTANGVVVTLNGEVGDQFASPVDLVFVIGLDNQVYAQKLDAHGNPAWGYFLVQPGAVKAISPGRDCKGNLELFVIGLNDRVYSQKFDSNGNPVGGYVFTTEGAVQSIRFGQDAFNRPEIFAIGLDSQVYVQKFDANGDSTSPYVLSTVGQVKSLSVGHDAANHPELFVVGLDDQVYAQKFDANGGSMSPYLLTAPGQVKSLSVGRDAGNRPELVVIGLNDHVYAQKFDANGNSTSSYFLAAVGQVKSVSVGRDAGNRPELFVIGLNDQVYAQKFDEGGSPMGGYFFTTAGQVKSIKVSRDASNRPELFVIGLNDQVYAQEFNATGNSISSYFLTATGVVKTYGVSP
jgi:hypothetical protein